MSIDSSPGESPPALKYQAKITLIGPTWNGKANYGVDRIQVGFHQTVHFLSDRALDATTILKSSVEGMTYLDSESANVRPWQYLKGGTYLQGPANQSIISANDSPVLKPIVNYESPNFLATSIQESEEFTLSVAAATLDTSLHESESHLFQEADASWSLNLDGSVAITGAGKDRIATWTPGAKAGVKGPMGDVWDLNVTLPADDSGLLTTGTLANNVGHLRTFDYIKR